MQIVTIIILIPLKFILKIPDATIFPPNLTAQLSCADVCTTLFEVFESAKCEERKADLLKLLSISLLPFLFLYSGKGNENIINSKRK